MRIPKRIGFEEKILKKRRTLSHRDFGIAIVG